MEELLFNIAFNFQAILQHPMFQIVFVILLVPFVMVIGKILYYFIRYCAKLIFPNLKQEHNNDLCTAVSFSLTVGLCIFISFKIIHMLSVAALSVY